jgi:4-hydroxy-tetrahydrodipicolinate synthase
MKIHGLIPATCTPFHPDGSIDYEDLERHIITVATSCNDLFGIAVNGHAGEILTLTSEERVTVVATAKSVLPKHLKLIAGIQGHTPQALVKEGLNAAKAGADALLVLPPFDVVAYRRLVRYPDVVYQLFSQLDREVGLPMIVFLYPEESGCQYSVESLQAITDIQNVVGIKAWVGSVNRYAMYFDELSSKVAILAASDGPALLGMLLYGAAGALIAISVVGTPFWAEVVREATSGNAEKAREIFRHRCLPLTKALFENEEPYSFIDPFACIKEALVQLGQLKCAYVRPPAITPDDARRTEIRRALSVAGLLAAGD